MNKSIRTKVTERGDKFSWTVSFDGFYLTHGYHSKNCSVTLHNVSSGKIATAPSEDQEQTGRIAAEGDMLQEALESAKAKKFNIQQIVMDHDTSGGDVAVNSFPEVRISYCGNHTAKSFHNDITKLKLVKYKVTTWQATLKREFYMTFPWMNPKNCFLLILFYDTNYIHKGTILKIPFEESPLNH